MNLSNKERDALNRETRRWQFWLCQLPVAYISSRNVMLICLMSCLHVIVHVLLFSDTAVTSNSLCELATTFLFREVFARTGPLSRYLQGIEVDLSKALNMIDCVIEMPFGILAKIDVAVSDLGTFDWRFSRLHSKRARGPSEFLVQYETGLRIIEHYYHYFIPATSPCM